MTTESDSQKHETLYTPISGYVGVVFFLMFFLGGILTLVATKMPVGVIGIILGAAMAPGFFYVNPNGSRVLVLFGKYIGTVRENGFYWTNPFFTRKSISLRARNFDSERIKVNDKLGNPILISVILVWRVKETFKAAFEVDDYESFVRVQSDAAVRKLAGKYPYDNFDDHEADISLRSGLDEINEVLESELDERLNIAGIEILEARIGYLAYAQEIAGAMLRRQQAQAIIAARHKIVEGAVSMVEMALDDLSKKEVVHLDEERKAAMVSNLMVVLCADKDITPVVNSGTLNH